MKEALGRPTELSDDQLRQLEILYTQNRPATEVARHLGLTRQRIYYYYNKFTADKIPKQHQPSIQEILQACV